MMILYECHAISSAGGTREHSLSQKYASLMIVFDAVLKSGSCHHHYLVPQITMLKLQGKCRCAVMRQGQNVVLWVIATMPLPQHGEVATL